MKMTENKKKKTLKAILLGLMLVLLAVVLVLFVMPQVLYRLHADPEAAQTEPVQMTEEVRTEAETPQMAQTEWTGTAVELPLTLEDGKLQVESLFQFDGINPDSGNQEQDQIAAILVRNLSKEYLTEAEIVMELSNGVKTSFVVTNLPGERAAMVFSADNSTMKDSDFCVSASCKAQWDEMSGVMPEGIAVSVDGITVTVTNQTAQDIPELTVYCHSLLEEDFFGGITYTYKIENLSANAAAVLEVPECFLGMAEVVRIAIM